MKKNAVPQIMFPSGEFSHTDIRRHTNDTLGLQLINQHIWPQYKRALNTGVIIRVGTRRTHSKGKPEFVHVVNSSFLQLATRSTNWALARIPGAHYLPDFIPAAKVLHCLPDTAKVLVVA